MDDVNEVIRSVPAQFDELLSNILSSCHFDEALSKLCEKCSIVDDLISNAEQEAITIVTEAAQRTEAMKAEFAMLAEMRVEIMKIELANLRKEKQQQMEAMNKELADLEEEKKRRTEAMKIEFAKWEEEKKRIAKTHIFEPMVTLNVGGKTFTTATATLTRFPDTMLGVMFSCQHALTQDTNGSYFIDRDGRHFHEILNFLRGSTACTPELLGQRLSSGALEELKVEADYYGMKELMFPEPMSCKSWKAEPVVIKSRAGWDSIVTQGGDKLWYVEHPRIGTPRLVTVCDHCGVGYISHKIFWDSYLSFTNGRTIMKNQPRPCGTCPRCNDW